MLSFDRSIDRRCSSFVEEARRISEERLLAEQLKTEAVTLRKHYSEADVSATLAGVRGRLCCIQSTIHRLQSDVKVLQNENDILREKAKQVKALVARSNRGSTP